MSEALEYLANQRRLGSGDSGSPAGLAEILAWETRGDDVYLRKSPKLSDVAFHVDSRKARFQDTLRTGIDFAEEGGFMAGSLKAQLDAADAGEQAKDGERFALASLHGRH